MKKVFFVFFFSWLANLFWEYAHAPLYANYMGGPITDLILFRASFWDAVLITLVCIPFFIIPYVEDHSWAIIVIGIILAIIIEWHALATGRWMYGSLMPIVPFLNVGLTPLFQLGLLGYIAFELSHFEIDRK